MIDPIVTRLLVAALCGLAVGLEREWSGHASGPRGRFAGIRTFFLLGGGGGVAGWLASSGSVALGATLLAGAAALVVAAYAAAARRGGSSIEGTTEVAALVVIALGTLAGLGFLEVASGSTAVMVLVLSEKERLRAAVSRIGAEELHAAFTFAVLALVVLPLLPDQTYGPFGGVRLRALWIVVLMFSGLNFLGYLARKAVGPERGFGVAGMLGGVISSTAVSFQFARLSREPKAPATGLAIGVVGACTVLLPRLLLLSAILSYPVAIALLPFLLPPLIVGTAMVLVAFAQGWETTPELVAHDEQASPLRLWSAIKMALAFQAALMAISVVRARLGTTGVLGTAAILGLTDMDALTLSMNRLGSTPDLVSLAARAIAVGVVANSLLKLTLVLLLGGEQFRQLAGIGLALLTLVTAGALWVFW